MHIGARWIPSIPQRDNLRGMNTQTKPENKLETNDKKPARERFRMQIRTGVAAGNGNRLFDSQNQNGKRILARR
jgi:hypothetical protein